MKHLFYVHSQSCLEVALRFKEKFLITNDQLVIFNARNVPGLDGYNSYKVQDELEEFPFFTQRELLNFKFLRTKGIIARFDALIGKACGGSEFILYAHNGRHYKFNVISSHPSCVGINYIEDGLDIYAPAETYLKKYPIPVMPRYKIVNAILGRFLGVYKRIKQKDSVFWSKGDLDGVMYTLHKQACWDLSGLIKRVTVLRNSLNRESINLESYDGIFLPSALDEQGVATNEDLVRSYSEWLRIHSLPNMLIKFHPVQSRDTRDYCLTELNKIARVDELTDSLVLERYFSMFPDEFYVVGEGTSLLLYAALFNDKCKVHVTYNLLERYSGVTVRSDFWKASFNSAMVKELDNVVILE